MLAERAARTDVISIAASYREVAKALSSQHSAREDFSPPIKSIGGRG